MKYLRQFTIIMSFAFMAEVIHSIVPLPIPASIYGLLIMLAALEKGVIKPSNIKDTALFLIEIMPVMFIPAAVGIIEYYHTLKGLYIEVGLLLVLTTAVTIVLTGLTTQVVIKRGKHE